MQAVMGLFARELISSSVSCTVVPLLESRVEGRLSTLRSRVGCSKIDQRAKVKTVGGGGFVCQGKELLE